VDVDAGNGLVGNRATLVFDHGVDPFIIGRMIRLQRFDSNPAAQLCVPRKRLSAIHAVSRGTSMLYLDGCEPNQIGWSYCLRATTPMQFHVREHARNDSVVGRCLARLLIEVTKCTLQARLNLRQKLDKAVLPTGICRFRKAIDRDHGTTS
jgi:hypothetical protein